MKPELVGGMCTRPLRSIFLERLMDAGTWCSRDELAAGASSSPVAVEDALADLVIEGKAEYRSDMGYRLAGSVIQRRAVKLMRSDKTARGIYGEQLGQEFRIGVAEQVQRNGLDLVMYELSFPMPEQGTPESLARQQQLVQALIDFNQGSEQ